MLAHKLEPGKTFRTEAGGPSRFFRNMSEKTMALASERDKQLKRWTSWHGVNKTLKMQISPAALARMAAEFVDGEDWVSMVGNGRVSIMYSCPWCKCAPLHMNGWVRAKKQRRLDWFCPKCVDKRTHGAGDSSRWILISNFGKRNSTGRTSMTREVMDGSEWLALRLVMQPEPHAAKLRAIGQCCAVHVPQQAPTPLKTGELVSLCHTLLALVDPEWYDPINAIGAHDDAAGDSLPQCVGTPADECVAEAGPVMKRASEVIRGRIRWGRSMSRLCLGGLIPEVKPQVIQPTLLACSS
eukprot:2904987-Amphidinium_carterae.1